MLFTAQANDAINGRLLSSKSLAQKFTVFKDKEKEIQALRDASNQGCEFYVNALNNCFSCKAPEDYLIYPFNPIYEEAIQHLSKLNEKSGEATCILGFLYLGYVNYKKGLSEKTEKDVSEQDLSNTQRYAYLSEIDACFKEAKKLNFPVPDQIHGKLLYDLAQQCSDLKYFEPSADYFEEAAYLHYAPAFIQSANCRSGGRGSTDWDAEACKWLGLAKKYAEKSGLISEVADIKARLAKFDKEKPVAYAKGQELTASFEMAWKAKQKNAI